MGLTLNRHVGEQLHLLITPGTTQEELWEALQDGITIRVVATKPTSAMLKINADHALQIVRSELLDQSETT